MTTNLVTALRSLATLAPDLRVRYVTLSAQGDITLASALCSSEEALHDLWRSLAEHADSSKPIEQVEHDGRSWFEGRVTIGTLEIGMSWWPPATVERNAASHARNEHAQEIAP